jgi:hypothetical protein
MIQIRCTQSQLFGGEEILHKWFESSQEAINFLSGLRLTPAQYSEIEAVWNNQYFKFHSLRGLSEALSEI